MELESATMDKILDAKIDANELEEMKRNYNAKSEEISALSLTTQIYVEQHLMAMT